MTNPKIKVEADVTAVGQAVTTVGQTVAKVNREAVRVIEQLRVAGRKLNEEQIAQGKKAYDALRQSGARGTRAFRDQSFEEFSGGGYQRLAVSRVEAERIRRQVFEHIGLVGPHGVGGGQGFAGFARNTSLQAGRGVFQSMFPFGGPGGTIMRHSVDAARDSGGFTSGAGMSRLAFGGGIGLAAFGAIKGVQSVTGKIGAAEDESAQYADLLRQIGGTSAEFSALRESVRAATRGMGLTYDESAKLAAVYAHEARVPMKDRMRIGGEVGLASGFARASGTDVTQSTSFFGALRHYGVISGERDQRRIAGQLQEAVAATGKTGGMGELLDTMRQFVTTVGARTLGTANFGGILSMASRLTGFGMPGLTIDRAADLASRMDRGFAAGAGGEASDNLLLSVMRSAAPGIDALDLPAIREGGLYGTGASVFGEGSVQFKHAQARGDTAEMERLRGIQKALGSDTIGARFMSGLSRFYGGDTRSMTMAASTALGIGPNESAAALAAFSRTGQVVRPDAAFKASELSDGDKTRNAISDMSAVFQGFAAEALPLLTGIRDAVVWTAGIAGFKLRDPVAEQAMLDAGAAASGPNSVPPASTRFAPGADLQLQALAASKTPYDSLFADASAKHGVPVAVLKAIAAKESRFNPGAIGVNENGTTDHGIMQHNSRFMRERGLNERNWRDPAANINAGAAFLSDLRKRTGNWRDAIRAYNGSGPRADAYRDSVYPVALANAGGALDPMLPPGARVGTERGRASSDSMEHRVRFYDHKDREVAAPLVIGPLGAPQTSGLGTGTYAAGY